MKSLRTFLWTAGLLLPLALHGIVFAQGGTTCATAVCVSQGVYTSNQSNAQQWYSYLPATSGTVTIQSCPYTTADTYVYLYNSCSTYVTYNDDGCLPASIVTYPVTANTQYYVVWVNTYTSATFQWSLSGPVGICAGNTLAPSSLSFNYIPVGLISGVQNIVASGTGLSPAAGTEVVTTTAPFEISLSSTGPFSTNPINLPYTGGALPNTTIYVRFHPTVDGSYSQNIVLSGGTAPPANCLCTGTTIYAPCIPQFNNFNLGSITNVTFGTMNFSRPPGYSNPPYYDYSSTLPPIVVVPGLTYPISVTWSDVNSYTALCYVYFDWNNNGVLGDAGEEYNLGNAFSSGIPNTVTGSILVPLTATMGVTDRMRVRIMNGYAGPCALQYGEAQDFSVSVVNGSNTLTAVPSVTNFTAEETGSLPSSKNITVNTTPTSFAWTTTLIQAPAPDWFSVTPTSGTGLTTIAANILRTNLVPGTYQGTLLVNSATTSSVRDTVNYVLVPRVAISPAGDPVVLKFGCNKTNGGTFSKSVAINNSGGHFGSGQLRWTATTTAPEISITSGSGVEGGNLVFNINGAALANGTYTRTITLTGYNSVTNVVASNSPYTLTIRIEVEPNVPVSQTQLVPTTTTQFSNSLGHAIAQVKSNNGTIAAFTVNMTPCTVPNGLTRLRYVRRVYSFSASSASPNVDLTLYYTANEAAPMVLNPALLKVYRQPLPGGSWTLVGTGGVSNPVTSSVTVTGVTALSGTFALAHSWSPKLMNFNLATALYDPATQHVVLQWSSDIDVNPEGFSIERINADNVEQGEWELAGIATPNGSGDYGFTEKVTEEGTYLYRVYAFDKAGNAFESRSVSVNVVSAPGTFSLEQNYPNPFNPATTIRFTVPQTSNVTLKVYDVFWRVVATLANGQKTPGSYTVTFDAGNLTSGTYFYRLEADNFSMTRKLSVMK